MPALQLVPEIADKLELFRTEILASSDPVDKRKQVANAAMDELLDSTVGLENFVVTPISVSNTRAGLYIYLNAAVSVPKFQYIHYVLIDQAYWTPYLG